MFTIRDIGVLSSLKTLNPGEKIIYKRFNEDNRRLVIFYDFMLVSENLYSFRYQTQDGILRTDYLELVL